MKKPFVVLALVNAAGVSTDSRARFSGAFLVLIKKSKKLEFGTFSIKSAKYQKMAKKNPKKIFEKKMAEIKATV